ncbi:MAG TPA: hypothetical protein VJ788_05870 [Gemmatimonadota bacterium]|nr:hypothetical protein [Gemmatimonadota bacterium]
MPSQRSESERRSIAALAYILGPLTGIICILVYREDQYVRFHAWQSLLLGTFVGLAVVALDSVPLLGLGMVFFLCVSAALLTLLLMWQAWSGRWFVLPLLGDVALEIVNRDGARG